VPEPLTAAPAHLPTDPGVYMMKDAGGEVLYVGKARNLRARVRSYFSGSNDDRMRIPELMTRVCAVEVVVTATEKEALILESTLVRKFMPRFNVLLRDDKTWLSIKLSLREQWPRVSLVRQWRDDGARYFGPYLNGLRAREVERLIRRAFSLRTCTDGVLRAHSKRPCIEYNMGNCVAPCVGHVTPEQYDDLVRQVIWVLEGRNRPLVRELRQQMEAAAAELRFEDAAELRDRISVAERVTERQRVQRAAGQDSDAFGLFREGDVVTVAMLPVRDGKVEDPQAFTFAGVVDDDPVVLEQVILQLYGRGVRPAPELLLPLDLPDTDAVGEVLGEAADRIIRCRVPRRGAKVKLLAMATENARVRHAAAGEERKLVERATVELRKRLHLRHLPHRIECFDISHLGGEDTVASMVVLQDGKPLKRDYRSFTIRTAGAHDDYAAMAEVMTRRLARVDRGWTLPDLLLVDGGKGQLGVAVTAAAEAGLEVPLAGLAKPDAGEIERDPDATDKVFLPGRKNPVRLLPHSPGLHMLQRVRDEAHRFAVSLQRRKRKKRTFSSVLEDIPGVGPGRRRTLLRHFGSVKALKAATEDEIAAVQGIGAALARVVVEGLGAK
jgi:excinuclease ABC subunit C